VCHIGSVGLKSDGQLHANDQRERPKGSQNRVCEFSEDQAGSPGPADQASHHERQPRHRSNQEQRVGDPGRRAFVSGLEPPDATESSQTEWNREEVRRDLDHAKAETPEMAPAAAVPDAGASWRSGQPST
jgi:hypothetical protein